MKAHCIRHSESKWECPACRCAELERRIAELEAESDLESVLECAHAALLQLQNGLYSDRVSRAIDKLEEIDFSRLDP